MREYQQRMHEAGSKDFDSSSSEGFMAAKILTKGLRRLGGKSLRRESLVMAPQSLCDYDMGGFSNTDSAKSHKGSRDAD